LIFFKDGIDRFANNFIIQQYSIFEINNDFRSFYIKLIIPINLFKFITQINCYQNIISPSNYIITNLLTVFFTKLKEVCIANQFTVENENEK
jgi:hypothetical protein